MNKVIQNEDKVCPTTEKLKFFFWFWTGWTLALMSCNSIMH